jgi:ElaB/YqjD/DUF883 family membrane-anchored ribosome-binding protein
MKTSVRHPHNHMEGLREMTERVRTDIRELGGAAKSVAGEKFDQWYKDGREKTVQLSKGLEKGISARPFQSVLIAAGVGFLAGLLIRRR